MSTPWTIDVDGVVLPKPLSGHPALELCNSRAGWREPPVWAGEYLRSYDALALLAATSGVITDAACATLRKLATKQPAAVETVLERTRELRGDLYVALTDQPDRAARGRLAEAISGAHARQHLVVETGSAHWEFDGSAQLNDPLDALLIEAGSLLAGDQRHIVTACPGVDCGWLFLNPSRRRRWCQMAVCGNRAKQAAFARRQRH